VAPFLPQNAQQAHARLAITVFAEPYDHASAPTREATYQLRRKSTAAYSCY
jgi:hypothetical protein